MLETDFHLRPQSGTSAIWKLLGLKQALDTNNRDMRPRLSSVIGDRTNCPEAGTIRETGPANKSQRQGKRRHQNSKLPCLKMLNDISLTFERLVRGLNDEGSLLWVLITLSVFIEGSIKLIEN